MKKRAGPGSVNQTPIPNVMYPELCFVSFIATGFESRRATAKEIQQTDFQICKYFLLTQIRILN
jgi:hypothetical protein